MLIHDCMSSDIELISAEGSIQEAAQKMARRSIGFLPVVRDTQIVGVVTDRDITVRSTALGGEPTTCLVQDVMTREMVSCFEDQPIEQAIEMMDRYTLKRLLVFNRHHRLKGILSRSDLPQQTTVKASSDGATA